MRWFQRCKQYKQAVREEEPAAASQVLLAKLTPLEREREEDEPTPTPPPAPLRLQLLAATSPGAHGTDIRLLLSALEARIHKTETGN